jgi:hypothetical protein
MSTWADIDYRDFWDVPRIFFVRHQGRLFLFDCPFNDDIEDYGETYTVYVMPELSEAEWGGSWAHLSQKATQRLGEIPIDQVQFDPSKRRQIDTAVLNALTLHPARTPG